MNPDLLMDDELLNKSGAGNLSPFSASRT